MAKSDARRYRRISLNLPAHIVVNTVDEYDGELINISPGNLAVMVKANVVAGDAVVVRIPELDVIEGTVARTFPDGFAVSFMLPKRRRAVLTEKLMLLSNKSYAEGLGDDRRSTPRHRVAGERAACLLEDGTSLYARIVDISVDGMSLDSPRRPPVGSEIHVGRRRGVVVRHTPRGFAVMFQMKAAETTPILRVVSE